MDFRGKYLWIGVLMKISLRMKLFIVIFLLVAAAVATFALLASIRFSGFVKLIQDSGDEQEEIVSQTADRKMLDTTIGDLCKLVGAYAELIDGEFWTMRDDLEILSEGARDILMHPDAYGERQLREPDSSEAGKLTTQLLYSKEADREDRSAYSKIQRLANLCGTAEYIVGGSQALHDVVIAIPEGLCIVMDRHPEDKIGYDGQPMTYSAKDSPEYKGAVSLGQPCFAPLNYDIHHAGYKVSLGIPVIIDGETAAVVSGSRFLSNLDFILREMSEDVGEDSFVVLVSDTGEIIFSERDEGELSTDEGTGKSILDSGNSALAGLGKKALSGEEGYARIVLDGEMTYFVYAPLETVGWTMMMGVSEETLKQPSKELVAKLDEIDEKTLNRTEAMTHRTGAAIFLTGVVLIILSVFTSLRYSRKLVRPIKVLKDAGVRFNNREDTGFEYTQDFFSDLNLYTGDETEELWLTMKELEQNVRSSMHRLKDVTAEKERIDTELSIAARLQSDMLPKVFPAFPERTDFDLFASMKPAKEVGGDFYDFFLTDDDHLVLVMADVSGKGVPAALFMVVARTMIKNLSLSEGCESPGKILEKVNNNLCENNDECMFVTVWLGCITLSTGKLKWASAGHEYPALCRAGGNFELIKDIHGPGLGTFEDIAFEEQSITLGKGDRLFLYTDGIPEATDEGGSIFGTERMTEALDKSREEKGLSDMASSVKSSVDAFVKGTPQFDDITMMMFEYRGI